MTNMDVVYRFGLIPGEREMRAIDGVREVYGVRKVAFNEKEKTVRVEYDASRLKEEAVAKLLRQAGIDVTEKLALA
jgi:copper chaperone CopZ